MYQCVGVDYVVEVGYGDYFDDGWYVMVFFVDYLGQGVVIFDFVGSV